MSGNTRHLFPGNNTSGGFFSYYGEILPLDRANRFYCLKGGPGTGKSTFLRKIAEDLQRKGWDTEYLHCSSDSDSLDGVCFPEQKIALIDGTAPHITDPVSPGAVDRMVDLSVCWDEGKLRGRREEIRASQKQIAAYFRSAYRYLGAARKLYEGLEELNCLDRSALHYLAARIQREELAHKALMPRAGGRLRKLFLTGITPKGIVTYLPELLQQARRVYAFQVRPGADCTPLLNSVAESALARGCDAELFYNPLKPAEQAMHLYLPEEKLAVVTVFADREEAELCDRLREQGKAAVFDLTGEGCGRAAGEEGLQLRKQEREWRAQVEELVRKAVNCIAAAHAEHDRLEAFYIAAMNFEKLEEIRREILQDICNSAAERI